MDGLLYAKFDVIGLVDGHKELNTKEWVGLRHDLPPTVILYRLKPGTRLRVFYPSILVLQPFEVRAIIRLIDEVLLNQVTPQVNGCDQRSHVLVFHSGIVVGLGM